MTQTARLIRNETGSQRLLGYDIDIGRGDGTARTTMTIGPTHPNRQDMLHGGLSATLLDTAMGAAASLTVSDDAAQRFSTLSLTVQFLAPGRPGPVEAVGRITGGGHRTLFAEGVLTHLPSGVVIATASGVFQRARKEPSE